MIVIVMPNSLCNPARPVRAGRRGQQRIRFRAWIVRRVLRQVGWDRQALRWTWPLVASHHGVMLEGGAHRHGRQR
jgi:hypothetical protein